MTTPDAAEHAWAHARLELHVARLLSPAEESRLAAHADSCASCLQALATMADQERRTGDGEHVPASVLARWPGVAELVPALERELIEQHLERCPACRYELRLTRAALAGAEAGTARASRPVALPAWWMRAWATAATAAAAGFALLWWSGPRAMHAPVHTPATSVLVMRLAPDAARLHDRSRGTGSFATTRVEPGPHESVALEIVPMDVPDEAPVAIEVARASGPLVLRSLHAQRELYPARELLLGDEAAPLADGDYLLRMVAWPGTARADSQAFAFSVRRRR